MQTPVNRLEADVDGLREPGSRHRRAARLFDRLLGNQELADVLSQFANDPHLADDLAQRSSYQPIGFTKLVLVRCPSFGGNTTMDFRLHRWPPASEHLYRFAEHDAHPHRFPPVQARGSGGACNVLLTEVDRTHPRAIEYNRRRLQGRDGVYEDTDEGVAYLVPSMRTFEVPNAGWASRRESIHLTIPVLHPTEPTFSLFLDEGWGTDQSVQFFKPAGVDGEPSKKLRPLTAEEVQEMCSELVMSVRRPYVPSQEKMQFQFETQVPYLAERLQDDIGEYDAPSDVM